MGAGWDYFAKVQGLGLARGCGCPPEPASVATLHLGTTPAEQAAAADQIRAAYANMGASGANLLQRWGPGMQAIADGARALDAGSPADQVWATMEVALTAMSMAGPVGAAISAIGRVITEFGRWLVDTYPATQVVCAASAIRQLCRSYTGLPDSPRTYQIVLRDQGRFWIGSTHNRSTSRVDWSWAANNENICKPYLPGVVPTGGGEGHSDMRFCTYMDRGSEAERMARLEIACRPIRRYKRDVPPPLGSTSWQQWENERPEVLARKRNDEIAAVRIGEELRDHLVAVGDPKYVGTWGDLCAWYGFWVKVSALPNESLVEVLSRVAQSAPAAMPDDVDPKVYIQPAPDQPGVIYWQDGLADAYMRFFSWVYRSDKTYAVKALIDEYNRRLNSGAIRRIGAGGGRTIISRREGQVQTLPSAGISPAVVVGGLGLLGLLAWAALK